MTIFEKLDSLIKSGHEIPDIRYFSGTGMFSTKEGEYVGKTAFDSMIAFVQENYK